MVSTAAVWKTPRVAGVQWRTAAAAAAAVAAAATVINCCNSRIYTQCHTAADSHTYLVRIYSTEISIGVTHIEHYDYWCCTRVTRTATTTKSSIIQPYNVHTTDHMILVDMILLNVMLWYWYLVRAYLCSTTMLCFRPCFQLGTPVSNLASGVRTYDA